VPATAAFDGRIALVTGGSRGIGAAVALALAEAGADIAINYQVRADAAEAVARAVRATGRRAELARADVSDSSSVARMLEDVRSALGPIDILVNNAGIGMKRAPSELTEEDWDATIAVNLKGAFLCTRAVIPGMQDRRFGRVVNISSGAARGAGGIGVHYNASKAGLEGLTRGYAARYAGSGITVNAVAPSLIATDMMPATLEDAAKRIPVGRAGRPEEVAAAVVMVASNAYMTGQTVQLNGGLLFI
jgi:3-oxoacyl-[acyl-carrier protein] reductase